MANMTFNLKRLENIKKRLQTRRHQQINKQNEARSVEAYSRGFKQEKRLSNGNIPCYA